MRRLGALPDRQSAELFRDHLDAQGVRTRLDRDGTDWVLWIHDEDKLPLAREQLAHFQQNPADPRYAGARENAAAVRTQRANAELAARQQQVRMSDRWRGGQRHIPVTVLLITLSIGVAIVTRVGLDQNACARFLMADWVLDPQAERLVAPGIWELLKLGQFHRWISPIFLHFGPMHLFFNMSATLAYGREIEQRSGSLRFLGMVLLMAVISNLAQYAVSGPTFGGMSGVDFGLFGFLWMKSRFAPDYGVALSRDSVTYMLMFAGLCVFGAFGRIANTAHFAGMFTGMALAMIPLLPRIWRMYVGRR
jgi:GlpG protein